MQNMNLKIASLNHPPYVVLNETEKGVWDIAGGIDGYVIHLLKEKFCFKYEVIIPVEPEWGQIVEGRWTGVIGMVYRNEVDIAIANIMITQDRHDFVALSVPYNEDGWVLVSLAPRVYENWEAIVHPFQQEVWCALFVSILISSCLLFTLQVIRSRFKWTPYLSWRNTLWNVVAVLCQEGVKMKRIRSAGLVYFTIWIFATMILYTTYGGTLIGFLTFPTMESSIDTLEKLAEALQSQRIQLCTKKFSLVRKLLIANEEYGDIFSKSLSSSSQTEVSSYKEAFQSIITGNYVFLGNEFGCKYDLYLVDFTKLQASSVLGQSYIVIAFSRTFQYQREFNIILRRLSERGLIHKWRSDILFRNLMKSMFEDETKLESQDTEASKLKSLNITQLSGAFLLLLSGHLLGFIVLMSEMFYSKYHKSKENKPFFRKIK